MSTTSSTISSVSQARKSRVRATERRHAHGGQILLAMEPCRVSSYEGKILEKLKSLCLDVVSWEGAGETTSSTTDQGRALSTENEAGAMGIFDNPWQDGSEDAVQFWHDEGGPDSLASAVEDESAPRRRKPSTSTSSRIVPKFRVCGWSEDAFFPLTWVHPDELCRDNRQAFRGWVPSTAVMDMFGVSAGTSVSIVVVVPADNSPPCAEAVSPSNGPTTSVSWRSLNLTFDDDIQFEETRTSGFLHELGCRIWSWVRACRVRGWQLRGSPSNLRERFVAYFGCRVGPVIASELCSFLLVQEQCWNPA